MFWSKPQPTSAARTENRVRTENLHDLGGFGRLANLEILTPGHKVKLSASDVSPIGGPNI